MLLLFLTSCTEETSTNEHKTTTSVDTNESEEELNEKPLTPIQSLLMAPLDLAQFKKSYGPSNSGAGCSDFPIEWRFNPQKEGFYYQYMLFHSLQRDMKNIEDVSFNEYQLFENFRIYVYHYGKNGAFDFFDENEELIGLRTSGSHTGLGNLDLVGKSIDNLHESYGTDYIQKDDVRIYHFRDRALSLKFREVNGAERVEALVYAHLSKDLDKNNVPGMLLDFSFTK